MSSPMPQVHFALMGVTAGTEIVFMDPDLAPTPAPRFGFQRGDYEPPEHVARFLDTSRRGGVFTYRRCAIAAQREITCFSYYRQTYELGHRRPATWSGACILLENCEADGHEIRSALRLFTNTLTFMCIEDGQFQRGITDALLTPDAQLLRKGRFTSELSAIAQDQLQEKRDEIRATMAQLRDMTRLRETSPFVPNQGSLSCIAISSAGSPLKTYVGEAFNSAQQLDLATLPHVIALCDEDVLDSALAQHFGPENTMAASKLGTLGLRRLMLDTEEAHRKSAAEIKAQLTSAIAEHARIEAELQAKLEESRNTAANLNHILATTSDSLQAHMLAEAQLRDKIEYLQLQVQQGSTTWAHEADLTRDAGEHLPGGAIVAVEVPLSKRTLAQPATANGPDSRVESTGTSAPDSQVSFREVLEVQKRIENKVDKVLENVKSLSASDAKRDAAAAQAFAPPPSPAFTQPHESSEHAGDETGSEHEGAAGNTVDDAGGSSGAYYLGLLRSSVPPAWSWGTISLSIVLTLTVVMALNHDQQKEKQPDGGDTSASAAPGTAFQYPFTPSISTAVTTQADATCANAGWAPTHVVWYPSGPNTVSKTEALAQLVAQSCPALRGNCLQWAIEHGQFDDTGAAAATSLLPGQISAGAKATLQLPRDCIAPQQSTYPMAAQASRSHK